MIIEFEFDNFKSFKNDQFFSMERPKNFGFDNDSIIINDKKMLNLSRVAAIYGANAAGKTNFLDALRRLRFIITRGRLIQFPFVSQRNKSSRFNLLFITKLGMKYRYKIEFTNESIQFEELLIYKSSRPTVILRYLNGELELGKMFSVKERNAIEFNFEKNRKRPIIKQFDGSDSLDAREAFDFFKNGLLIERDDIDIRQFENEIEKNPEAHDFINRTIRSADLGIQSISFIEEENIANETQQKILKKAMIDFMKAADKKPSKEELKKIEKMEKNTDIIEKMKKLIFQHEIDDILTDLDATQESDGTIAMGWILLRLIPVLRDGKTYVIDEIDESLHPTLVAQIVEIFNSEESNPNNAQLIFSTHDVSLLDGTIYGRDILDRDQIWFVEKDLKGCSYLYSLYDIKYLARKDDNFYKKYLSGMYGATSRASLPYAVKQYWQERSNDRK